MIAFPSSALSLTIPPKCCCSAMTLSESQRKEIARSYRKGDSIAVIARRFRCSRGTAKKWAERGEQAHPTFTHAHRTGRPKSLQQSERSRARRMARSDRTVPQITSSINKQRQQPVSKSAVRRALIASKSPLQWVPVHRGRKLSAKNKEKRLLFCKKHKHAQWGAKVYGDSKFYYMYKDRAGKVHYKWCNLKDQHEVPTSGDPIVLHFYGFVSKGFKSPLYFVAPTPYARSHARKRREAFASRHFIAMLPGVKPDLIKGAKYSKRNPIVLDHAKQHTSKASKAAMDKLELTLMQDFPAQCWDLNIIENVWGVLDGKLSAMPGPRPTTPYGWRRRVERAWAAIDKATINKLVDDVPRRVARVVKEQGEWLFKKGTK